MVNRIVGIIQTYLFPKAACKHEFLLKDLKKNKSYSPPLKPKSNTGINAYKEWSEYFDEVYNGDGIHTRVKWKCNKCEQVFSAHCGLDILNKHKGGTK